MALYSDADFRAMETDPELEDRYYWRMAARWKSLAAKESERRQYIAARGGHVEPKGIFASIPPKRLSFMADMIIEWVNERAAARHALPPDTGG